jgi:hypothetical protein
LFVYFVCAEDTMSKSKARKRKPEPYTLTVKRPESPIEAMAALCVEVVAANAATTLNFAR